MPSHMDPLPPIFHHSPAHVFAAASMKLCSQIPPRRIARCCVELPEFFAGVYIKMRKRIHGKGRGGIRRRHCRRTPCPSRRGGRHREGSTGKPFAIFRLRDRPGRPQALSGRCVQSLHASIDDGDKHLALVQCNTPAVHTAAKPGFSRLRHRSIRVRVIPPDLFAGFRIDGCDDAPVRHGMAAHRPNREESPAGCPHLNRVHTTTRMQACSHSRD